MSPELLKQLRDAITKAEAAELQIVDCFSAMVCERDHKDVSRTGTFEESAALLQAQLFDRQRTVDLLKLALARATKNASDAQRSTF